MRTKIHSMRQALLSGAAMMLITAAGAGAANATVFGGSATFMDYTSGNALDVSAVSPNPAPFSTTNLKAGTNQAIDYMAGFMTLATTDSATGDGSCVFIFCTGVTNTDNVGLTFAWTQPSTASDTSFSGAVSETTFTLASYDRAGLTWANDTHVDSNGRYAEQLVTFGNGAQAEVDLYDTVISGTTSARAAQFDVRIIDKKDAVPEPMSMAVLGVGLLGLGIARRRKSEATQ